MDPQQIASRLKALMSSLHPAQLASLVAAFVLVVGIMVGSTWWLNTPSYVPLFVDMDTDTAGEVVERLKALKVNYRLDEGGRTVRVPHERADELRLQLTSQGMPSSGRVGYEIFDRTSFTDTEFQEQVKFRRALEGELARTIGTIAEVSSARVHLTLGKEVLFGEPQPAKASVMLKLRGQRSLSPGAVTGLSNLVAFSVQGLRPESVIILDGSGRPLSRPTMDDEAAGSAGQIERQHRIEQEMGARVVALLQPVVGPDRVRVNVAVKLNQATVEQTVDQYDPAVVVRSRQVAADTTSTVAAPLLLAGARGNAAPVPDDPKDPKKSADAEKKPATSQPAPSQQATTGASRTTETTNYEVGHTTTVTQRPPGDVARLSVAVIVDDDSVVKKGQDGQTQTTRRARTPEELQKIEALVVAAVGLEPERGDQIKVQNMSFEEPAFEEAAPLTTLQQVTRYTPQIWEGARMLLVGLIGLAALLFFVKPLMQRAALLPAAHGVMATIAGPGQPIRTVADLEHEIEAQLDATTAPKLDSRRLPVLARRASSVTAKEPENVAKLLRNWINEGER